MAHCLIALGSNLGDRATLIRQALEDLVTLPGTRLIARSRLHETAPIGGPAGQGAFLNAAALVATALEPIELLAALRLIESQLGRVREERWAARSLDLDILLYDDAVVETAELAVPHPRMAFRRFVLEPAAEVAAWMLHPESGWTVGALLDHLNVGAPLVAIAGDDAAAVEQLQSLLTERLNLPMAPVGVRDGDPPAVVRWDAERRGASAELPRLLLALAPTAGIDPAQRRRMLRLPPTGPIAWLPETGDMLSEAVAAVQAVWPELAS
jgi:2-amino-4-hydroxy-6-hydroxymethyldihydropteridine diphosphokinase